MWKGEKIKLKKHNPEKRKGGGGGVLSQKSVVYNETKRHDASKSRLTEQAYENNNNN